MVASAIHYGVVCWGSSISDGSRKKLKKLSKKTFSVMESPLKPVEVVSHGRMVAKLSENTSIHAPWLTASSVTGCCTPGCRKERFCWSFLPAALRLQFLIRLCNIQFIAITAVAINIQPLHYAIFHSIFAASRHLKIANCIHTPIFRYRLYTYTFIFVYMPHVWHKSYFFLPCLLYFVLIVLF